MNVKKNSCTKFPVSGMLLFLFLAAGFPAFANPDYPSFGADAVPDLYAPNIAGPGGFTTSQGGAPTSGINPAQAGDARRIVFDFGYLAIPGMEKEQKYGQSIEGGMLLPTKVGVFGASLRYIGSDFNMYFPIQHTFGGNVSAAKEIYPGMSIGAGLNFGVGNHFSLSGDLGFRYNTGKLGPFQNFTWAVAMRGLGVNWTPSWLTPIGGVAFDMIRVDGKDGKKAPFVLKASGDIGFPSLFTFNEQTSMTFKTGLEISIIEMIKISASWPGASGLNVGELAREIPFTALPSIGIGFDFVLPSSGKRIAGGRLPADGDIAINAAFKPLYEGLFAAGAGITWNVGVPDRKPPLIIADYPETAYFSPNNDGKADALEFPISITDANYVMSWSMEIRDSNDVVVRTYRNKELRHETMGVKEVFRRITAVKTQVEIPPVLRWDGIFDSGEIGPDGEYTFTITAADDSGNSATTASYTVVLDNTPPEISIAPLTGAQLIFSPDGDGNKDTITFVPKGSVEDRWESGIWDASGNKIRAFKDESGQPQPQTWDGADDSGKPAPDGIYSYRISATDRAQNTASAALDNIILDTRASDAFLTSSVSAIAPKADQSANIVQFDIMLSLREGIENWRLELKDNTGAAARTFAGDDKTKTPPASIGWNGFDEKGAIVKEGLYTPELTVNYTNGKTVNKQATPVLVDVSGPELSIAWQPEYFSPDNDGVEDDLFINLAIKDASPIASWSFEIREEASNAVFYRVEGKGRPAERLVWDGRSSKGERVQSATDYPYTFRAEDSLGNASSIDGKIGVDVLVIREGDILKIQIPSIQFVSNSPAFDPKFDERNTWVLQRIARSLNKFRDYKVTVEGHANPTTAPGTAARDREETENQRLSLQRAQTVVEQLVKNGVARSRLKAEGKGGTRTIVPYDDLDNRWKNRRVEFILIK